MSSTALLDRIKGKREQIKQGRAAMTRAYKFKQGKTVISLLPLHEDIGKPIAEQSFFREFGQHFLKNKAGETVVVVGDRSLVDPGAIDEVREGLVDVMRYANEIGDKNMAEKAKESMAKKGYLFNAMIHQDPDMKKEDVPQLASISETMFDSLAAILEEFLQAGADDVLRFNDRLMFVVERTGSGKNDTRYTIMPAAKRMTIDPSVMAKATNLSEYIEGQFADQPKALAFLSTILGRSVSGSTYATALTGSAPAAAALPAAAPAAAPAADLSSAAEDLLAAAPVTPAAAARTEAAPALSKATAPGASVTTAPAAAAAPSAEDLLKQIDDLAA